MGIKETFANMGDDLKAKIKNVKSAEEFDALMKEENIELTLDQVEELSGGQFCPYACIFEYCDTW